MDQTPQNTTKVIKALFAVLIIIVIAGFVGWRIGHSGSATKGSNNSQPSPSANTPQASSGDLKSLISYQLPDGWKEASCPSAADVIYIAPTGTDVDCNTNPSSPVKISIDQQNSKDCNDLQNVQNVKKHICISLYIDGHKTLKATTEYLASSTYQKDTTVNSYYLDTGKKVVKLEYRFDNGNEYQADFDQLANSVHVK